VHERAALLAGKDRLVDSLGEILVTDDQAGARSTQCFVGGSGGNVRVRYRGSVRTTRHEACNVRHVEDVVRANLVGNLAHAYKIPLARISTGTADDDLGLFLDRRGLKLVIVNGFGVAAHVVERGPIELAAEAEPVTMRQVAAVREIETENRIARLKNGRKCRCICL